MTRDSRPVDFDGLDGILETPPSTAPQPVRARTERTSPWHSPAPSPPAQRASTQTPSPAPMPVPAPVAPDAARSIHDAPTALQPRQRRRPPLRLVAVGLTIGAAALIAALLSREASQAAPVASTTGA